MGKFFVWVEVYFSSEISSIPQPRQMTFLPMTKYGKIIEQGMTVTQKHNFDTQNISPLFQSLSFSIYISLSDDETRSMTRNRIAYLILVFFMIGVGLLTRSSYLPEMMRGGFITMYAGDALWAAMVYFMLCVVFPKLSPVKIAVIALSFSFAVEVSQLFQQDWLNQIRDTRIGKLVLGRGFLWSDFLCYTAGVLLAYLFDSKVASMAKRS